MDLSDFLATAHYGSLGVCVIWSFVVGFLWYSEWLFGPTWRKAVEFHKSQKEINAGMKRAFGLEIVGSFLLALVLDFLLTSIGGIGTEEIPHDLVIGVVLWLGFVLKGELSKSAWEQRPFTLVAINGGASLVTILGMTVILAWM